MFKQLLQSFLNLKIKYKFFLSFIFIILITGFFIGLNSYLITKNSITKSSIQSSKYLMEQLSMNFEYTIKSLEDFIFLQTFQSGLSSYIRTDNKDDKAELYNKSKSIDAFTYNLLNVNKYIKAVVISDEYGNYFYNSYDLPAMEKSEMEKVLYRSQTTKYWGKSLWSPYDEKMIFVSSVIFDNSKLNKIGLISVGVDVNFFKDIYKNINSIESNSIVVLDKNHNILIPTVQELENITNYLVKSYDIYNKVNEQFLYNGKKYMYTTWSSLSDSIGIVNIIDMSKLLKSSSLIAQSIITSIIISIIIALFIAFLISVNISQNIKLLLTNIKTASKGDFTARIKPKSYDEIGMLTIEFNHMSEKIQNLIDTVYKESVQKKTIQLKALQFEYDSLQSKINPHFLYNTLETINSLAKIKGEKEISHMIYLLGNLLRKSISSTKSTISLFEELDHVKCYLEIQKISYGEKIDIKMDLDEALMEAVVPKFILQPLVENAIVHGIETKIQKSTITIISRCDNRDIILEVIDDGIGMDENKVKSIFDEKSTAVENDKHTKIGILSVHKRIRILYGEAYGVNIESKPNVGTKILIRMPLLFEGEKNETNEV